MNLIESADLWLWFTYTPYFLDALTGLSLLVVAVLITAMSLRWALRMGGDYFGLVDHPGGHRTHGHPTPLIGGIAITVSMLTCCLAAQWFITAQGWGAGILPGALIVALLLLLAVGVWDDARAISVRIRFGAQALAALVLVASGVMILDIGLATVDVLPWAWLAMAAAALITLVAVVGCINAYNLVDGMDGLAAGLGAVTLTGLLALVMWGGQASTAMLVFAQLGALLGFLWLNLRVGRPRALVFLGDAGSTTLGLLLAYWVIVLSQPGVALLPPESALWLLGVPIIDTLRVMIERWTRGDSPFNPGHDHLHHLLQGAGFSVNRSLAIMLGLQALMVAIGVGQTLLQYPPELLVLAWLALLPLSMMATRSLKRFTLASTTRPTPQAMLTEQSRTGQR
ncbi:glycosyltransferase family 4 protein [Ectothiorhodospira variabilis]|uniref:glycosyltransferase family 4 protein n=1 Tax=Ectothiorhodospira variabilis TaxID=505694 RepID=UPI001EFBAFCA|nr:MraY family glycosyltransferase [Ectothiorhodospira variabilis]MCG5498567.1 undecaprenyl/decaprenyl-phosphate alpha-N-acetylglucosaminyl 1-phosphate transferase [Ectothiorhodospira variabilis]